MKALLLCLLAAGVSTSAGVIFSNGAVDTASPLARSITIFRTADDFVLAGPATLDAIRFWMLAEPGVFGGALTYAIYQDSGGALGPLLNTAAVNVSPKFLNKTPGFIYSLYLTEFSLPSALPLSAGTYWLELHDGPTLTTAIASNVYWEQVGFGATGNARQSPTPTLPSGATGKAMAFELISNTTAPVSVPEPGTWALCLAGLAASATRRGWRRRLAGRGCCR